MENTSNSKHRKKYLQGYTFGLLPVFYDCEDMLSVAPHFNNEAFISGFYDGRFDYEKLNGKVTDGIPDNILTEKILDDFETEGRAGIPLDTSGYTDYQKQFIIDYYEKGCSRYEANSDISLFKFLSSQGIGYN